MMEYNAADIKNRALQKVESHAEYIDKMEAKGINAYFIYDTGWNNLFLKISIILFYSLS